MSDYNIVPVAGLHDRSSNALVGFLGADGQEYLLPVGANVPERIKISGIEKSILASLVAAVTYGQEGNLVTVTATAHGLPTNKNGYRIFWPGSAAIDAGWFSNFQYLDANTFTFDNGTEQTVAAGTSMTGSAVGAYISMGSITFSEGYLADTATLTASLLRTGSTVAVKYAALFAGAVQMAAHSVSTQPNIMTQLSASVVNGHLMSSGTADNATSSAPTVSTVQTSQAIPISIRGHVSAVGSWMAIEVLTIELKS